MLMEQSQKKLRCRWVALKKSMCGFSISAYRKRRDSTTKSVLEILEDYENFTGTYRYAVAAFEDLHTRLAWSDKLTEVAFVIISLSFPKAYVSSFAQINQGCIVES